MPPKEISRVYEATVRFILTGSHKIIENAIEEDGIDFTLTSKAKIDINVTDIKNLTQVKEKINPANDPRQIPLFK